MDTKEHAEERSLPTHARRPPPDGYGGSGELALEERGHISRPALAHLPVGRAFPPADPEQEIAALCSTLVVQSADFSHGFSVRSGPYMVLVPEEDCG